MNRVAYLLGKKNNQDVMNMTMEIVKKTEKSMFDIVGVFGMDLLLYVDGEEDIPFYESNLNCYNPIELMKFRSFLKRHKVDIIHVQHIGDACFAKMASWLLPVKVVFTIQDKALKSNIVFKMLSHYVVRKTDALLFISETQRKNFLSKHSKLKNKHYLLPNSQPFHRIDANDEKTLRERLFIPTDCHLIGTVGDFTSERDFLFICQMVRQLWKKGRDFHCVIAGRKNKEFEDVYNECVSYCLKKYMFNYVTLMCIDDYDSVIKQFDVFVYVVNSDNVGFDMTKAMASGVPVVVNDTEATRELSHNGKYAYLYKTGDAVDFAEKTDNVMRDEDAALVSGVVKNEIRERGDVSSYITKVKSIYDEVVGE